MKKNKLIIPVLKWVGGKRQLLQQISPLIPKSYKTYCEPFIGGGAVFFHLQPKNAIINDSNTDLMNVYNIIKSNVEELIHELEQFKNESDFFYEIRQWDKDIQFYRYLSDTKKAARVLYLNKTCYNGLYRVNNAGEFNTPFGNYKNPNIVNAPVLRAVHHYFNISNISFLSQDYELVLKDLPRGSFVYLDPPYDPVSKTSNFTGYTKSGFGSEEQERLKSSCDALTKNGIKFLLSNSSTELIHTLYKDYKIEHLLARRSINSVGTKRGDVEELLIRNYE